MFSRSKKNKRPWFRWREECGLPECPYLIRWFIDLRLFSIRVHNFKGSDDDRALHDHGWDFVTLILKGYYDDVGEDKTERMKPGMVRYRKAEHKHTVQVGPEGAWTLIVTGPRRRRWGFWSYTKGGKYRWFKANKYFFLFGHHPCSDSPTDNGEGVDSS